MVRTRNAAWFSALVAAAVLALALSSFPFASNLEARGAALVTPLSGMLYAATRPLADVLLHAGQLRQLTQENSDLRAQVAQLDAEASALRDQQATTEQARSLQAAVGPKAGYVTAGVTVRDPAPGRRGLVIDRGAGDGILPGQPVLAAGASLVGVVTEVQPHSARVRLLDDHNSAVAAVLQQSRTPGALIGDRDGLRLDFVPTGTSVAVGDLVVTSPLGGRLPAGLLIGRVASVSGRPEDLFESIRIEPYSDYSRLLQVMLVPSFRPEAAP